MCKIIIAKNRGLCKSHNAGGVLPFTDNIGDILFSSSFQKMFSYAMGSLSVYATPPPLPALADPATPGSTSVQPELLSCLASLRAFPATLTLFLVRSCSALPPHVLPG